MQPSGDRRGNRPFVLLSISHLVFISFSRNHDEDSLTVLTGRESKNFISCIVPTQKLHVILFSIPGGFQQYQDFKLKAAYSQDINNEQQW